MPGARPASNLLDSTKEIEEKPTPALIATHLDWSTTFQILMFGRSFSGSPFFRFP
jgi:hypothetical protein